MGRQQKADPAGGTGKVGAGAVAWNLRRNSGGAILPYVVGGPV